MKRLLAVISGLVLAVLIVIGGFLTRSGVLPIKSNEAAGFAELLKISFESVVRERLLTDPVNSLTARDGNESDPLVCGFAMAETDPKQKEGEDHEDENKKNHKDEKEK
jgi:hypothetical protein